MYTKEFFEQRMTNVNNKYFENNLHFDTIYE